MHHLGFQLPLSNHYPLMVVVGYDEDYGQVAEAAQVQKGVGWNHYIDVAVHPIQPLAVLDVDSVVTDS